MCLFHLVVRLSLSIGTDAGVRDGRVVNSFARPKQTANSWVTSGEASLNTPVIRRAQNDVCVVADGGKQLRLTLLQSVSLWQRQRQQQQQFYRSICQSEHDCERCCYTFSGSHTHSCDILFVSWSTTGKLFHHNQLKWSVLKSSEEKPTQTQRPRTRL